MFALRNQYQRISRPAPRTRTCFFFFAPLNLRYFNHKFELTLINFCRTSFTNVSLIYDRACNKRKSVINLCSAIWFEPISFLLDLIKEKITNLKSPSCRAISSNTTRIRSFNLKRMIKNQLVNLCFPTSKKSVWRDLFNLECMMEPIVDWIYQRCSS